MGGSEGRNEGRKEGERPAKDLGMSVPERLEGASTSILLYLYSLLSELSSNANNLSPAGTFVRAEKFFNWCEGETRSH